MTSDPIAQIARRHGFSEEAARTLVRALQATGGGLAQFNHPELGGQGQWMPGMTMVGQMFNASLKARVEAICTELAALVMKRDEHAATQEPSSSHPESLGGKPGETMKPMEPMRPMESMKPMRDLAPWWSEDLGQPTATGGQNDLRYAYFAGRRRLVVAQGGKVTVYDTADHEIGGVSQQQSDGRNKVVFISQHGKIPLANLNVIGH